MYHSAVIEFLNSNDFKLHSPAQVRTMSSQLCTTVIGKNRLQNPVTFNAIYSTLYMNPQ